MSACPAIFSATLAGATPEAVSVICARTLAVWPAASSVARPADCITTAGAALARLVGAARGRAVVGDAGAVLADGAAGAGWTSRHDAQAFAAARAVVGTVGVVRAGAEARGSAGGEREEEDEGRAHDSQK